MRIMGVPERMENIRQTQEILKIPDENIFIDYEHEGVKPTARRAWSKETDKSHVMVLQDDVELCKDFLKYCYIIINKFPDFVVSLFPFQFRRNTDLGRWPVSPYVQVKYCSGQGVIMRSDYINPCLSEWKDEIPGDDTNIERWANSKGIKIISTLPSIIQHIGDDSVYDPSRSVGRTVYYDPDPVGAMWESDFLNIYTNISRKR